MAELNKAKQSAQVFYKRKGHQQASAMTPQQENAHRQALEASAANELAGGGSAARASVKGSMAESGLDA